jgi:hypothetical protein
LPITSELEKSRRVLLELKEYGADRLWEPIVNLILDMYRSVRRILPAAT